MIVKFVHFCGLKEPEAVNTSSQKATTNMNDDYACHAIEAILKEEIDEETQSKTIDTVLQALNVSDGQLIVHVCKKFGDDFEKLSRFLKTTAAFERQRSVNVSPKRAVSKLKESSTAPQLKRGRGRPPKALSPDSSPKKAKTTKAPSNFVADVAEQAAHEKITQVMEKQGRNARDRIIQINGEFNSSVLQTGQRRRGAGVSWSDEEVNDLTKLIMAGHINAKALSREGENPHFDRSAKSIANKANEIKAKFFTKGVDTLQTDSDSQLAFDSH
jgi:hypothetical protein